MKSQTIFWSIGAIVLIALGVIFLTPRLQNGPLLSNEQAASSDWTRWNGTQATLIEYSDFQCPACAAYENILQQSASLFSPHVTLVYRHFPLPQHRNARAAAEASEAAGKQGKFWEMHDKLFAEQGVWSESDNAGAEFEKYAEALGLNIEKYRADIASGIGKDKISSDQQNAARSRLQGTPTFFLNGVKLENITSAEDFQKRVMDAVVASTQSQSHNATTTNQ